MEPNESDTRPNLPLEDSDVASLSQRILEEGFLEEPQLGEARVKYLELEAPGVDFAGYLYKQGLLSRRQMNELGQRIPLGDDTSLLPSKVGTTFSGFTIERKLGQGGMGTVYLAHPEGQDDGEHDVVVKFLAADKAIHESVRRRFRREAEVLRRLSGHPHVVEILEVAADHDEPHIVMQYVQGPSLEKVLSDRFCLEPEEAARFARDAARGLAVVHEQGIVHRDIKPGNLIIDDEGKGEQRLVIVDFGLAKDLEASGITQPGRLVGTPHYMAPEQWQDHQIDARCDLFALGATLYHMLVGEPPFRGKSHADLAKKVIRGDFVLPRKVAPEIPADLELVVMHLLMPERAFRYGTATECAEDLERFLRGESVSAPRLEELKGVTRARYVLMPKTRFLLGRDEASDVTISHPSISRQHARLEREATGFVLNDLGSTYGTFVNDRRVTRPLSLRDGDVIRLGKSELAFRDERQPARAPSLDETSDVELASSVIEDLIVPEPVMTELAALRDRRTVVFLIERLAPRPAHERAFRALTLVLGEEAAEGAHVKLQRILRSEKAHARQLLHQVTGEDHGEDSEAWIGWWLGAAGEYPGQLVTARPPSRGQLRVTTGDLNQGATTLAPDGGSYRIGRHESCQVRLSHRSVSRHHATVVRLHQRLAIRDEGSRFGTLVNGRRVKVVFLEEGDTIKLGRVELVFREPVKGDTLPRGGLGVFYVDPEAFDVLVELGHPSVATALVGLLHAQPRQRWLEGVFSSLEVQDPAALASRVARAYGKRAQRARELLPDMLGAQIDPAADEATAWRQLLAEKRSSMTLQVKPLGWLPEDPTKAGSRYG